MAFESNIRCGLSSGFHTYNWHYEHTYTKTKTIKAFILLKDYGSYLGRVELIKS